MFSFPGRDVNYSFYDSALDSCAGGLSSNLNVKYAVLGNLFMNNYYLYVVHSEEEATPRLGLAPQSSQQG